MWNTSDARARIEDEWRNRWFPFPFNFSERCKAIDDWEAGKHLPGDQKPKKLSDDWKHADGLRFLRDYEAMVLAFCQKKWPRLRTAEEQDALDKAKASFQFNEEQKADPDRI